MHYRVLIGSSYYTTRGIVPLLPVTSSNRRGYFVYCKRLKMPLPEQLYGTWLLLLMQFAVAKFLVNPWLRCKGETDIKKARAHTDTHMKSGGDWVDGVVLVRVVIDRSESRNGQRFHADTGAACRRRRRRSQLGWQRRQHSAHLRCSSR